MEIKKFAKGDVIIKEGSKGDEIYFLNSGKVKVYKVIEGEKVELGELTSRSFFGEMSCFLGHARTATVEAVEETEVNVGDKEKFLESLHSDPHQAINVIKVLAKRLVEAHKVISEMQSQKMAFELILLPRFLLV